MNSGDGFWELWGNKKPQTLCWCHLSYQLPDSLHPRWTVRSIPAHSVPVTTLSKKKITEAKKKAKQPLGVFNFVTGCTVRDVISLQRTKLLSFFSSNPHFSRNSVNPNCSLEKALYFVSLQFKSFMPGHLRELKEAFKKTWNCLCKEG